MAYTALYRKYRPRIFDDIVEQQHIVRSLKNSVRTGQIAHAYLFCGTRGTGKTSMAHILSRAINCLDPVEGNPCNKCEICSGILSGSILDVLELDAASNNSVDNIRDIRDEVVYSPSHARYKVYIIDEVHMLSTGAFNALLKTLEEPPSHVVFILATTEPHRLPATVLSRCQRYDFHRITTAGIMKKLFSVAEESGLTIDERALKLIALKADGALRDALSILDRCASIGNKAITLDDVLSVAGIVDYAFLSAIAGDIIRKDTGSMLNRVAELVMEGKDIRNFTTDLITYFRNLLVHRMTGDLSLLAEIPDQVLDTAREQAMSADKEQLTYIIKELSSLEASLRWAVNPRILLEVALIKLCENIAAEDESLSERLSALERRVDGIAQSSQSISPNQSPQSTQPSQADQLNQAEHSTRPNRSNQPAQDDQSNQPAQLDQSARPTRSEPQEHPVNEKAVADRPQLKPLDCWQEVLRELRAGNKIGLYAVLADTAAYRQGEHSVIIADDNVGTAKMIASTQENTRLLEDLLEKKLGTAIKVKFQSRESMTENDNINNNEVDLLERIKNIAEKLNVDTLEVVDE
jgi:DNA polymerase-3 subunit gamma/tau